jgi:site-specific DNA recombinase
MMIEGEGESVEALAVRTGLERTRVWRTLKLAFLSPALMRGILEGRHPSGMSLTRLLDADLPLLWRDQPDFLTDLAKSA